MSRSRHSATPGRGRAAQSRNRAGGASLASVAVAGRLERRHGPESARSPFPFRRECGDAFLLAGVAIPSPPLPLGLGARKLREQRPRHGAQGVSISLHGSSLRNSILPEPNGLRREASVRVTVTPAVRPCARLPSVYACSTAPGAAGAAVHSDARLLRCGIEPDSGGANTRRNTERDRVAVSGRNEPLARPGVAVPAICDIPGSRRLIARGFQLCGKGAGRARPPAAASPGLTGRGPGPNNGG
jgi:hypothetical protein